MRIVGSRHHVAEEQEEDRADLVGGVGSAWCIRGIRPNHRPAIGGPAISRSMYLRERWALVRQVRVGSVVKIDVECVSHLINPPPPVVYSDRTAERELYTTCRRRSRSSQLPQSKDDPVVACHSRRGKKDPAHPRLPRQLTSTRNLLGRQGQLFLLFGMLSRDPEGRLCLEDGEGTVVLDMEDAVGSPSAIPTGSDLPGLTHTTCGRF